MGNDIAEKYFQCTDARCWDRPATDKDFLFYLASEIGCISYVKYLLKNGRNFEKYRRHILYFLDIRNTNRIFLNDILSFRSMDFNKNTYGVFLLKWKKN